MDLDAVAPATLYETVIFLHRLRYKKLGYRRGIARTRYASCCKNIPLTKTCNR